MCGKIVKYDKLIKSKLSSYKSVHLGIEQDGIWKRNKKAYPHILPENLYMLNILESFRDEFWEYFDSKHSGSIRLHQDFHHLNSSQALCFNLFFPFIHDDFRFFHILQNILGIPIEKMIDIGFEIILRHDEGTNFDFYIQYESSAQIFFELKYTENDFGSAKANKGHIKKYNNVYKDLLKTVIKDHFKEQSNFLKHYQIIRNLIYIGFNKNNSVIFIFPKRNDDLIKSKHVILDAATDGYKYGIRIIYLEELVDSIVDNLIKKEHQKLRRHFSLFKEKYLL